MLSGFRQGFAGALPADLHLNREGHMRGKGLVIGLFSVGALLTSGSACSRNNELGGDISPSEAITLQVRNNNFLDMDVYAVSQGLATRVGTVTGNSARTFVLSSSLSSATDFRIVATPLRGNGRASTGSVNVAPGQTLEFP